MKKQTIGFNERVQSKLSHIDFKTKPECSNTSWQSWLLCLCCLFVPICGSRNTIKILREKTRERQKIKFEIRKKSSFIDYMSYFSTHTKCRNGPYPQTQSKIHRFQVPDDKVSWKVSWSEYNPVKYTAQHILKQPWADPEIGNPVGRTGISGRGLLGRWGPNHAADPIVTRWKRDADGNIIKDEISNKPIVQFICIERKDCHEWAFPGGMVDPGEKVSQTLKREFSEEALNSLCLKDEEKKIIENIINVFFDNGTVDIYPGMEKQPKKKKKSKQAKKEVKGKREKDINKFSMLNWRTIAKDGKRWQFIVYDGYIDDPRNTDNAWMESLASNFHDDDGLSVGKFPLHAGDDAAKVQWHDASSLMHLYASHAVLLKSVVERHGAHW
ncbi:ADP-ribose pyrophosphatase, mitochondrial [Nymphon striatum]|nr:ADP-ribose pyrophosphatase, mitochondrial [Nymphon striatum]